MSFRAETNELFIVSGVIENAEMGSSWTPSNYQLPEKGVCIDVLHPSTWKLTLSLSPSSPLLSRTLCRVYPLLLHLPFSLSFSFIRSRALLFPRCYYYSLLLPISGPVIASVLPVVKIMMMVRIVLCHQQPLATNSIPVSDKEKLSIAIKNSHQWLWDIISLDNIIFSHT